MKMQKFVASYQKKLKQLVCQERKRITRAGKDDTGKNLQVTVYVGRPGMVFGRKGENLDKVKNSLRKYIKQEKLELPY